MYLLYKIIFLEYTADYNARKCKMVAHRRAIRCYETLFGIKMTLGASNNGETTMHMIFKGFKQYCVTLVVDDNYHIICKYLQIIIKKFNIIFL